MKNFKIELSEDNIELILEGLGELKYKKSAKLIGKIVTQYAKAQQDENPKLGETPTATPTNKDLIRFKINGVDFATTNEKVDRAKLIELAGLANIYDYKITAKNRAGGMVNEHETICEEWIAKHGAEITINTNPID